MQNCKIARTFLTKVKLSGGYGLGGLYDYQIPVPVAHPIQISSPLPKPVPAPAPITYLPAQHSSIPHVSAPVDFDIRR